MQSTYKIIWTEEARRGLNNILSYLEYKFSRKDIVNFSKKLNTSLELLHANPFLYPSSKTSQGTRRIVIGSLTSIIYKIEEQQIVIVTVYDNRVNPNSNQS